MHIKGLRKPSWRWCLRYPRRIELISKRNRILGLPFIGYISDHEMKSHIYSWWRHVCIIARYLVEISGYYHIILLVMATSAVFFNSFREDLNAILSPIAREACFLMRKINFVEYGFMVVKVDVPECSVRPSAAGSMWAACKWSIRMLIDEAFATETLSCIFAENQAQCPHNARWWFWKVGTCREIVPSINWPVWLRILWNI